eukprot:CFRG1570T1
MEIYITGSVDKAPKRVVHQIPFQVNHQGHANVSKYFVNHPSPEVDGTRVATFRGRVLKGNELVLHEHNSVGVLLKENRRPVTDSEERTFTLQSTFNSVHLWNHDKLPDASNDLDWSVKKWMTISAAIHDPIN